MGECWNASEWRGLENEMYGQYGSRMDEKKQVKVLMLWLLLWGVPRNKMSENSEEKKIFIYLVKVKSLHGTMYKVFTHIAGVTRSRGAGY